MKAKSSKILFIVWLAILGVALEGSFQVWAQQAPAEQPSTAAPAQPASPGPQAAAPVAPDEVVMTVGDFKMTAAEFEALTRSLPPDAAQALAAMGKKGFAERYASLISLAKEGEKRKVDQSATFRQMLAFQRLMLLGQLTMNEIVTTLGTVSAEEISYYYTAHQPDFLQIKLRGIYVPFTAEADSGKPGDSKAKPAAKPGKPQLTEPEAKAKAEALRLKIRGGESMAALAKKESDHASAANGGDMGWVRHSQFSPQIDNVIFALEKDQVSIPVKDRFGYFIFQLEDKRSQPLEEAKPIIENGLRQQKLGEALAKVQADYPPSFNPRFFPETAPTMQTMPGAAPAPPASSGK
jgi:hypothetical protein